MLCVELRERRAGPPQQSATVGSQETAAAAGTATGSRPTVLTKPAGASSAKRRLIGPRPARSSQERRVRAAARIAKRSFADPRSCVGIVVGIFDSAGSRPTSAKTPPPTGAAQTLRSH